MSKQEKWEAFNYSEKWIWKAAEHINAADNRIAELEAERDELREWKAKAIERARDEVLAEQASDPLDAEQARWQHAIADKIAKFVPNVCADGCDSGDPLDWSLAEIGIALQTALETTEQASEPNGCVYDGEAIKVYKGPHGEAWAVQDKHGVWWAHSKQMSAEQARWKYASVLDAVNAAKKLAGIEPEPEPDEPGPVPEWFASGCKKAGYGIHAELHWAGYIGDLCREALRQEGSDDGRN